MQQSVKPPLRVVKDINQVFRTLAVRLEEFLHKPLNSRLMFDMENVIITHLQDNGVGFPFVFNK